MNPTVKFYGTQSGTIGLWLSATVREHLDAEKVRVLFEPKTGKVVVQSWSTGLKITDNGFISASGFVRKFNLTPTMGIYYRVSIKTRGEIQFIVLKRSTKDVRRETPVPSY